MKFILGLFVAIVCLNIDVNSFGATENELCIRSLKLIASGEAFLSLSPKIKTGGGFIEASRDGELVTAMNVKTISFHSTERSGRKLKIKAAGRYSFGPLNFPMISAEAPWIVAVRKLDFDRGDPRIDLYDLSSQTQIGHIEIPELKDIFQRGFTDPRYKNFQASVALSPDRKTLYVLTSSNEIYIFDFPSLRRIDHQDFGTEDTGVVSAPQMSFAGTRALIQFQNKSSWILWNWERNEVEDTIPNRPIGLHQDHGSSLNEDSIGGLPKGSAFIISNNRFLHFAPHSPSDSLVTELSAYKNLEVLVKDKTGKIIGSKQIGRLQGLRVSKDGQELALIWTDEETGQTIFEVIKLIDGSTVERQAIAKTQSNEDEAQDTARTQKSTAFAVTQLRDSSWLVGVSAWESQMRHPEYYSFAKVGEAAPKMSPQDEAQARSVHKKDEGLGMLRLIRFSNGAKFQTLFQVDHEYPIYHLDFSNHGDRMTAVVAGNLYKDTVGKELKSGIVVFDLKAGDLPDSREFNEAFGSIKPTR